ncbi:MAG: DoxX family protein [Actinomycetota bacterium]|nr:DoxX family protein [Actinomycetota bacterium]
MDFGLFLLHAAVGLFFIGHGAQKLFGAFGGHGLTGTAGFFESLGLRPGRVHATAAGVAELVGGISLALGFLVPVGAALIVAAMAAATVTAHAGKGPWATEGGWELNATYAVAAVALAGAGAGAWSLDSAFALDLSGTEWALGALAVGLLGGAGAVVSGRLVSRGTDDPAPSAA